MVEAQGAAASTLGALVKAIGKGRRLPDEVGDALERLFGVPVALEGLSRLFQPGFPGVRTFAIETRVAPDQAVEMSLVGIARDGAPVWTGARAFVRGRDGSLEIHHGFDEVDPDHRSRNITVDLIQRELDILALLGGTSSRLTMDAEGVGSYICALHGFVFADETEEGPPVRSTRALEAAGDRETILEASVPVIERFAQKHGLSPSFTAARAREVKSARTPWDLAKVKVDETPGSLAEGDDGELGVGALGREILLARELPSWRAALYLSSREVQSRTLGEEYRRRKTHRSEARLAKEIQEARELLVSPKRENQIRALRALGMIAPAWVAAEVKVLEEGRDRRIAAIARQTLRQISGADLPDRMLLFAESPKNDSRLRGLAYRVLAEHFRPRVEKRVPMLRIHPDARVQRAIVPIVADDPTDAAPGLASMLIANPAHEGSEPRAGLLELRLELIERLTQLVDPRTLPALMAAYRATPPPPPAEMLALSRALVAFPDPRAQLALVEVARRLERPQIP